jgi:hypothetical protein
LYFCHQEACSNTTYGEAIVIFYGFCIDGRWAKCPNVNWIGDWVSKHLQPTNRRFVHESMYNAWDGERQYGLNGDELIASLAVGDNFVVNTKE